MRYAIERHRLLASLRGLSLVDELTGVYNRRGFMTLAQSHLPAAQRAGQRILLIFADLDGLKQINDRFGHPQGDPFRLSLSAGVAVFSDDAAMNLRDMLARAGQLLYERKRARKARKA